METNTTNTQQPVRPVVQPATHQNPQVARPVTQTTTPNPQTVARPVTAQTPTQPMTQPVRPVVAQTVRPVVSQPAEPEEKPTQTQTGAPVETVDEKPAVAIDETKTFTELNEYDSFKDEEKSFFAAAFTTYLPVALSAIALVVYMLASFMILVDAYTIANWIAFVAKAVSIASLVVETIRQIKAKKFEFNPSLIVVLLTIFVVM